MSLGTRNSNTDLSADLTSDDRGSTGNVLEESGADGESLRQSLLNAATAEWNPNLDNSKEALQDHIVDALRMHFTVSKGVIKSLLSSIDKPQLHALLELVERHVMSLDWCLENWDNDGEHLWMDRARVYFVGLAGHVKAMNDGACSMEEGVASAVEDWAKEMEEEEEEEEDAKKKKKAQKEAEKKTEPGSKHELSKRTSYEQVLGDTGDKIEADSGKGVYLDSERNPKKPKTFDEVLDELKRKAKGKFGGESNLG